MAWNPCIYLTFARAHKTTEVEMVATVLRTSDRASSGRRLRRAAVTCVLSGFVAALLTVQVNAQAGAAKPASSLILPLPKPPVPERTAPIFTPPASQPAQPATPAAAEPRLLSARDRDLFTQAVKAAAKRQWSAARLA